MSERKISRYMGIDPGKSGALALLKYQDDHLLDVCIQDCPVLPAVKGKTVYDPAAMSALLRRWSSGEGTSHVFVEVVHSMPGQGVSSMFDFGKGFGMWLGILAALQIPHTLLTPQRWKKAMLADIKQDKNASIARACQLFPMYQHFFQRKKDDGRAEALLIAEFGRRAAA